MMTLNPIQIKQISADGFTWNQYSPRVGSITNELTSGVSGGSFPPKTRAHFSRVCYFAFDSWDNAHDFWKAVTDRRLCSRAKVRESERFTSQPWEVKVWSMSEATLEKLVQRDRNRAKPKSLPLPSGVAGVRNPQQTRAPIRRDWSLSESYSAIQYEAAA